MIKNFNLKQKIITFLIILILPFIPIATFVEVEAQGGVNTIDATLDPISGSLQGLINIVIQLISISTILVFIIFLYGIYKNIKNNKKNIKNDKEGAIRSDIIIPSLIGLFVLTSMWGLIVFLRTIILPNDIMKATNFIIPIYKS